jgi:hypothetical protein
MLRLSIALQLNMVARPFRKQDSAVPELQWPPNFRGCQMRGGCETTTVPLTASLGVPKLQRKANAVGSDSGGVQRHSTGIVYQCS